MLQITLVIEDAKISTTELEEEIQEFEDFVQSTDIAGEFTHFVVIFVLTHSHAKALSGTSVVSLGFICRCDEMQPIRNV